MAAYKEVLRPIVFLHRVADDKDFNELVLCIPDSRIKVLEAGLIERQNAGQIDTVQIGRHRFEGAPYTEYEDGIDAFFSKVDAVRLHSSTNRTVVSETTNESLTLSGATNFTGFDDIDEV